MVYSFSVSAAQQEALCKHLQVRSHGGIRWLVRKLAIRNWRISTSRQWCLQASLPQRGPAGSARGRHVTSPGTCGCGCCAHSRVRPRRICRRERCTRCAGEAAPVDALAEGWLLCVSQFECFDTRFVSTRFDQFEVFVSACYHTLHVRVLTRIVGSARRNSYT